MCLNFTFLPERVFVSAVCIVVLLDVWTAAVVLRVDESEAEELSAQNEDINGPRR